MHTHLRCLRIIFLTISMMICMLSWGQSSKDGRVTATADPTIICAGGSSQLHATYIAPDPITYDFEDGMQGWTTINVDVSVNAWERVQNTSSSQYSHGGSYCMRAKYNSSPNRDYVVSPQITLGVGKISFYAKRYSNYWEDSFRVYISTSGNSNANDFSIELTNGDVIPGTSYSKFEYDLSLYEGQGYIAIEYTSVNQFYLYIDDITIYDDGSSSSILTYDFESGMQGWTTIDADGHGNAWEHYSSYAHDGSYCMSAKWNSSFAHLDYLVSPRVTFGHGSFSFYARKGLDSYDDTFRVYLSTTGNTNANNFSIELTSGNVHPTTSYTKYEYDLSAFQGQGYIAIVYTAPKDQYRLYVDDVTIEQEPTTPGGGSSGDVTFHWEPGNMSGPDPTVYPQETTTYTVTASNAQGTIGTAQVTVTVDPLPEVSIETESASICIGDTITLRATVNAEDYVWPGDILCDDGNIVHPADWTSSMGAQGVVFYVDATGIHGWVIGLEQITDKKWSTETKTISGLQSYSNWREAIADFDGYGNTQTIRNFGNAQKYPAAWAVDFEQGWYLPSIGQLNILFGEMVAVNKSLELLDVAIISYDNVGIWSSTACSDNKYAMLLLLNSGRVTYAPKTISSLKIVRSVKDF